MKLTILLVFCFFFLFVHNTSADEASCLSACAVNDGTCCGCCGASETCHQNAEQASCCAAGQGFCGCISSRAFCEGQVWEGTVTGVFGQCYDLATHGQCFYAPTPNIWTLCSADAPQPCYAPLNEYSLPTCCAAADTCGIDASGQNICVPPSPPAPVTCGSATCLPGDQCCADHATGERCFSPSTHVCDVDPMGGNSLCPVGTRACGGACYDREYYCCKPNAGGLTQEANCAPGDV